VPTRPVPLDWRLHTYGTLTLDGARATIQQADAAADVTFVEPAGLTGRVLTKPFAEAGVDRPFAGAEALSCLELRPTPDPARGVFLTVIEPRRAAAAKASAVTAVRADNVVGLRRQQAAWEDLALFALDAPTIEAAGVTARARTVRGRRRAGEVRGWVVQNGQRLVLDGRVLCESDRAGDIVVTALADGLEAVYDLADATTLTLAAPRPPRAVTVPRRQPTFTHDPAAGTVTIQGMGGAGTLRVTW